MIYIYMIVISLEHLQCHLHLSSHHKFQHVLRSLHIVLGNFLTPTPSKNMALFENWIPQKRWQSIIFPLKCHWMPLKWEEGPRVQTLSNTPGLFYAWETLFVAPSLAPHFLYREFMGKMNTPGMLLLSLPPNHCTIHVVVWLYSQNLSWNPLEHLSTGEIQSSQILDSMKYPHLYPQYCWWSSWNLT